MSSTASPYRAFPSGPLVACAALITVAIGAAALGDWRGISSAVPRSAPLVSRPIQFVDQPDGAIRALDATTRQEIMIIAPGTNGFLRATLHGLARERRREGFGPQPPFQLTAWRDGRLTLTDSTTGRRIELESFGQDNEAAFARLLTNEERQP